VEGGGGEGGGKDGGGGGMKGRKSEGVVWGRERVYIIYIYFFVLTHYS